MSLTWIENGTVCTPRGFQASGAVARLKRSGTADMALLYSESPATVAGIFTSCTFAAAPVQYDREIVAAGKPVRAVIVNSGNANACTGETGLANARKMAELTAKACACSPKEVLCSSTGRIGVQLPMDKIADGITQCSAACSAQGGMDMARAIMTTDTRPKFGAVELTFPGGKTIRIGGCCKGAGMIAPGMIAPEKRELHATMLAYITTDAQISAENLQAALISGGDASFNRVTVDGDMSTNDTALILANGASGVTLETEEELNLFRQGLTRVMQHLAREIARDGEGATKLVKVNVSGAKTDADADLIARAVAGSLLCKTAWFGGDPNWGRILAAIGYSKAVFTPETTDVDYDFVPVVRSGMDAGSPEADLAEILKHPEFEVNITLHDGDGHAWMWTSDISYEYVKINAEYFT